MKRFNSLKDMLIAAGYNAPQTEEEQRDLQSLEDWYKTLDKEPIKEEITIVGPVIDQKLRTNQYYI